MKGKIADFTVSIREGGPSAESHPGTQRGVRSGAAARKCADGSSSVNGKRVRRLCLRSRVVPREFAFRPCMRDGRHFFIPKSNSQKEEALDMKEKLEQLLAEGKARISACLPTADRSVRTCGLIFTEGYFHRLSQIRSTMASMTKSPRSRLQKILHTTT